MKKIFCLSLIFFTSYSFSQVVNTIPQFPTENDSIVVFFHANEGDSGLQGYTGEIYSHTGVVTNLSDGQWTNVIADWPVSDPKTKLTKISEDLYQLDIGYPREYYSVNNTNERILQLAFVFKNSDQSRTGRDLNGNDILINMFEEGLNVKIDQPENKLTIAQTGDQINIIATSSAADTLKVYIDDLLLAQTDSNQVEYLLDVNEMGKKWLVATAQNDTAIVSDSTLLFVRSDPTVAELPNDVLEGINYISNSTVILNLFAPNKEYVYVIGSFNNWELDSNYQMNKTPDDSTYWLTIENLTPQKEYGFQYYVDGELRIADPYTEKTLDPNDQFIEENIYPGLMEYPIDKTSEIISIIKTDMPEYNWENDSFTKPEKTDLVIYELWLKNFIEKHNFQTLIDTLDYLDNLGINVIELMPINEFEGNNSWGYNPSFYFAVDKNYGPCDDLKRFVDECHSRGIAVIIDMVLNHSYGQNPMVRLYFDKFANNEIVSFSNSPWYNVSSPNRSFYWGADFNHESTYTKKFIDRVNSYWLTEYKVDGFRFDFTKGFTNATGDGWSKDNSRISILKRMADEIWSVDSAAFVILEHLTENSEETELANYGFMLWGNMNSSYNEATMGYHENGKSNFSGAYYGQRGWLEPNLVTYMESHDEERLMYKNLEFGNSSGNYSVKNLSTALSRIKLASAFFYTIPGPKMIWQFGEIGFDYSINWPSGTGDDRLTLKPFVWNYLTDLDRLNLYKTTQALIKLKLDNEVFRSGDISLVVNGSAKRIKLTHESMNVVIIGNFNVTSGTIIPSFQSEGIWYDYFSGDSINVTNTTAPVELDPGEFHIYTTLKLPTPEEDILLNLEKEDEIIPDNFSLLQNYPNPFNPTTTIKLLIPNSRQNFSGNVVLKVFDILGREVNTLLNRELKPGEYNIQFDATEFTSGIYFYTLAAGDFYQTRKMILLK